MKQRFLSLMISGALMTLTACQPGAAPAPVPGSDLSTEAALNPGSKGPKPSEAVGTIATRFELGLGLNAADFQNVDADLFSTLQARSGFGLADIQRARVLVTPPEGEPVSSELSRQDIANGWVFLFRNLPVGQNQVSLDILGAEAEPLFSQTQSVLVEANLITPVNFVLDLDNPDSNCPEGECRGSIQVSVQARTQCFAVPRLPSQAKAGESVTFALDSLQGNVSSFSLDFGDGSPVQKLSSLPVRHTYARAGRYPIRLVLDGPACKSPFEVSGHVTVR